MSNEKWCVEFKDKGNSDKLLKVYFEYDVSPYVPDIEKLSWISEVKCYAV